MSPPPARLGVVVNPVHRASHTALQMLREHLADRTALDRAVLDDAAVDRAVVGSAVVDRGVLVRDTTVARPGRTQAAELAAAGVERVIVLGGDGTLRQVVAGLLSVSRAERPVLGIVPTGSANVTAVNLLEPRRPGRPRLPATARAGRAAALRVALDAPGVPLDVGTAELSGAGGETTREVFLTMAGLGNDAAAVALVTPRLKAVLGRQAYALGALRTWRTAPLTLRVGLDDGPLREVTTWTVLTGNLPLIPGRIPVFPHAAGDDGRLQVLTVARSGVRDWVSAAGVGLRAAARRRVLGPPTPSDDPHDAPHDDPLGPSALPRKAAALRWDTAWHLRVESDVPLAAQLDGDVVAGVHRADIGVLAGALRVARRT